MRKLLIIECIPKSDKLNEWLVLRELLRMTVSNKSIYIPDNMSSKSNVINYLERDLSKYDYVHLSSHGNADKCALKVGNAWLNPKDFPKGCFDGKTVTLSACELGRDNFIDSFVDYTSARYVIAPQRIVEFVDAALWFATFYYYVFHLGRKPKTAYERTKESIGFIKGNFQFWPK